MINNGHGARRLFRNIAIILAASLGSFALGLGVNFNGGMGHDQDFMRWHEVEAMLAEHEARMTRQNMNLELVADPDVNNNFSSAADMFRAIDNSVVSIGTVQHHRQHRILERHGAGSGIIFHETATHVYIATNYHVVQGAASATVSLDDIRTVPASFVGGEESSDLAVISVRRADLLEMGMTNYQVAVFGDSDAMEIGNFVLAVGNAYGEGKTATLGIVSALDKIITLESGITLNMMQTDAAINPGNSGGPLVNTRGEVIGINTARFITGRSEGMGFAIPSNDAVDILSQIMERGNVQRSFLGVTTVTLSEEQRDYYGFSAVGLIVREVSAGFAAESIGVAAGDIITHFNGIQILSHPQLAEAIARTPAGSDFSLIVMRDGEALKLQGQMTGFIENNRTRF